MKLVKLKAEKLLEVERVKLDKLKSDNMVTALGKSIYEMRSNLMIRSVTAGDSKGKHLAVKRIFEKASDMKSHEGKDLRFALKCLNED